jgi:dGTPase
VAQIARTLAHVLSLDEDLTEALALVHDIGHPPFAHAGEEELNRQMEHFGEHFDHNLHALHIVESFEQRYARFPGLNLTFEVREGIIKHSRDLVPGQHPEFDLYLPALRPPLEAQLIDLADEVAYNTADLDDGFSAGMFTGEDVAASVAEYAAIYDAAETQFPAATPRERFHEGLRQLVDMLVTGLIEGTVACAREAGVRDAGEVRASPHRLAAFSPQAAETSRALKQFLYRTVYVSPPLIEDRGRSMSLVAELFQFFYHRRAGPTRTAPPRNLRLHCRHDRRLFRPYVRGGYRRPGHSSALVMLESPASRTPYSFRTVSSGGADWPAVRLE